MPENHSGTVTVGYRCGYPIDVLLSSGRIDTQWQFSIDRMTVDISDVYEEAT
jgi:hypothetical protein